MTQKTGVTYIKIWDIFPQGKFNYEQLRPRSLALKLSNIWNHHFTVMVISMVMVYLMVIYQKLKDEKIVIKKILTKVDLEKEKQLL